MAKYLVTIKETSQKTVVVEADNEFEAEDIAESAYSKGDIVLDAEDFFENEFSAREITNQKEMAFKDLKIGQKFNFPFEHFYSNALGTFHEEVVGEFEKLNEKFAWCEEYEEGLDFEPNQMIVLNKEEY